MQNCTEWIIAYLGIAAHGATCVPLNSWWRTDELKYGVEHSEIKLLFIDKIEAIASIAPAAPNKCPVIDLVDVTYKLDE